MSSVLAVGTTICLVDVNAMFASCAVIADPSLAGRPLAVAIDPSDRRSIVLTASYEARALGVRTAMPLGQALAVCSDLVVTPPDHELYRRSQRAMGALLQRFTPLVEWVSIDEAFFDLQGCPALAQGAVAACAEIRRAIRTELNLPVSIGVSTTRFLAKMASHIAKREPSGVFRLKPADVAKVLHPLPIEAFHGIGPKTAARLRAFSILTIGQLALTPPHQLTSLIGQVGNTFQADLRGEGSATVKVAAAAAKSISHELTFAQDIAGPDDLRPILLALADQVASRLRRSGLAGRHISLTVRDRAFSTHERQLTAKQPACLTEEIFRYALTLLARFPESIFPCRLAGVSVSGLVPMSPEPVTLFDAPGHAKRALAETVDQIRQRYGDDAMLWASTLGSAGQELYDSSRHGSSFRTGAMSDRAEPGLRHRRKKAP
ncbi:MAG: DNA polymerase Y family protein [Sulfobacillus sp.]